MGNAQQKQKRQYDIKRNTLSFSVGDSVFRYNRRRETRKGSKLATRYDGRFAIAESLGKGVYRLTTATGSLVKVLANARDLKKVTADGYASPTKSPKTFRTTSHSKSPTKPPKTSIPVASQVDKCNC